MTRMEDLIPVKWDSEPVIAAMVTQTNTECYVLLSELTEKCFHCVHKHDEAASSVEDEPILMSS